jgi:hypothetical protein
MLPVTLQGTAPKEKKVPRELDIREDEIWHEPGVVVLGLRVQDQDEARWSVRVKIADLRAAVAKL